MMASHEDRRSIYWKDYRPFQRNGPNNTTHFSTTGRLDRLARHKDNCSRYFEDTLCCSPSHVTRGAVTHKASPRLSELSRPKTLSYMYMLPRLTAVSAVSRHALRAAPTARLHELAMPVHFKQARVSGDTIIDKDITRPITKIPSWVSECNERVEMLAKPKKLDARPDRNAIWNTPREVMLEVNPSERITELAKPKVYGVPAIDNDPFHVTEAAKKATISARIDELAAPLARKTNVKYAK